MSSLRKIQDLAHRIDRLGRYAGDPNQRSVTKERGVLRISSGHMFVDMCLPREGRVWQIDTDDGRVLPDFTPEEALRRLKEHEEALLVLARAKAREEVISRLVERRIRQITRAKSRGFKATKPKKA